MSKKRESLFKSEKERSFDWGITPNKSESLLKSDSQNISKKLKFIKALSWFFIQVIHKVVTTIHKVASQIFASWFYVLVTRSH